ncbi:MAG: EAL domain-containing protein [Deltaproteobacteria bacterium]|nr:EAL domain-containing protein [Deltaproteobacteria bacterium]
MEKNLRQAVEREELELHYQPIVSLNGGHVTCFEALLRWRHPQGYRVFPSVFVPVAERNQLIDVIGEWVIRKACKQSLVWRNEGFDDVRVSINLSSRQFHSPNLIHTIQESLADADLAADCLELEITESTAAHDAEFAVSILSEFKRMGVRLAIDDFGTGYSSLSYLKQFPIDILKIDQSFVKDIPDDADDAAIAKSIIAIAHSLDLKVVAEGVETEEQLKFLRAQQCDEIQGHIFSHALPVEEVVELLKNKHSLAR